MNQIETIPEGPFILNVLKPTKITSSAVVNHFKRLLPKGKKIGHFGTLDPFACGVLMLGISGGSRLNDFVHKFLPKTYLALGKLGFNTDTGDITGQIISEKPHKNNFSKSCLQELLQEKFVGPYWQAPPSFSAVKYKGKALYKWAREGEIIKKDPVLREIYSLEVVSSKGPYVLFRVKVSSGTYVRTLFEDIAESMGEKGTLVSLVRESVGGVSIKDSLRPKLWPPKGRKLELKGVESDHCSLLKMDEVLPFRKAYLEGENNKHYSNGRKVLVSNVLKWEESQIEASGSPVWILNKKGDLLGLSEIVEDHFRPLFNLPSAPPFCS